MNKAIILCADDFGYNTEVSQGIINLVARNRLSATSCMTNMPAWQTHIADLLKFREQINIGLHFNLLKPALPKLILLSYLRKLNSADIETELQLQLDQFQDSTGFLPDFIDGHQHIHQLPQIRSCLITVINRNYKNNFPYIRIASDGLFNSIKISTKALLIHLLGATALAKLARKHHLPINQSFAGFSNFNAKQSYQMHFENYLKQIKNHGLIMCHPGLTSSDHLDPIATTRAIEYDFFNSDNFIELLQQYNVRLTKERA